MAVTEKIWTKNVNNTTLLIDESFGLSVVSIVLQSGTGTVTGNRTTTSGIGCDPVVLTIGMPVVISADSSGALLDYVEIITTGVVAVIGR